MKYHGPDLFDQKACMIYQEPLQVYSTMAEGTYLRELWLLEDGTFVEVAAVSYLPLSISLAVWRYAPLTAATSG